MVDQFKKQVMFLHPEPSLMEPCAAMLGDAVSVHMAASGTEALTTLGITPIDIIVAAHDLPGMTGQEALREAKKRSPNTRGIMIASRTMDANDRAAMVNIKHLNQVLEARASAAEICAAIHQELNPELANNLPKPANDHSAGPRDGTAHSGSHRAVGTTTDSHATTVSFDNLRGDIPLLEPGTNTADHARSLSEVELVVMTNDSSFLKTIRAATGSSHVINHAPNLQEAIDIVSEGRCGVLLTDAAVAVKDVETITGKLRKHMPSLVTIVAGRREDGEKMMGLISDGLVYRFLLKPISPGRSRLAIEASAKKHLTLISTDVPLTPADVQEKMTETGIIKGVTFDSGLFRTTDVRATNINMPSLDDDDDGLLYKLSDALRKVPPLLLALAAVVITLIAVFAFSGDDDAATSNAASNATSSAAPATTRPAVDRYQQAMTRARDAEQAGRIVSPPDNNAVVYYAQAAALRRDDAATRAELERVLQGVFTGIERDLLADNINSAENALTVLNATVPGHPRLAFFNRQLDKELARRALALVEQRISSGDIAGARELVDQLRARGSVETVLLDALDSRLDAAPSAADGDPLALANQRMSADQLIAPAGDSARDYFRQALQADPVNVEAQQGLAMIASLLLQDARNAASQGQTDLARQYLVEAEATGANAIQIESVRRLIDQNTTINEAAAQTRAPAPVTQSPPAQRVEQDTSGAAAGSLVPPPPSSITGRSTQPEVQSSEAPATAAGEPAASSEPVVEQRRAATTPTPAPVETKPAADPLENYELKIVNSTPPEYPRSAQRRGVEGWADVQFAVAADGATTDITIYDSSPGSVFDRAAIDAVSKWRYEPLPTDDPNAVKRARIRLEFNLAD